MVTQVSFEEVYEAYVAYRKILRLPRNGNSRRKFFHFIGSLDEDKMFTPQDWMTEDSVRKIRWLSGPHAVAMYRVWEVQHGRTN